MNKFDMMNERLLTKKEVASRLGYKTNKAVNQLIKIGKLRNVAHEGFSCKFRWSQVLEIMDNSFKEVGK